ncbi:MAG: GNAT family N-acetyltransferase [Ignavibacteriales bacterium]|nr:GNAT family N-acetyltransferase [Ignavibacteriales bacterium]MCF8306140.1 GNAT family N-acetyltransferase [Ignavibacteriales bacterium]MCF8315806.1 GNAT family N-acetyltransferase [Ignavibacteriales bacterium]MCF8437266.1 GNAT family N-acetyltransferase [Ignavibacteriales bacterium]
MSDIVYKQLVNYPIELIHKSWINAFSDYAVPLSTSVKELKYMLERRGYTDNLSFGAFDKDTLIGFTLNGIRDWDGKLTAYDTGTGLTKEYRRQGIATKLFDESLPVLRSNNIKQYLLEVLQPNKAAFDLYSKKGFEVQREFDCYISPISEVKFKHRTLSSEFEIVEVKELDRELLQTFWDFKPSWQNSIASLEKKLKYLTIIGINANHKLIAYGVIENHTGDVPQIAVKGPYRRLGLGTAILSKLSDFSKSNQIRIINVDANCNSFRYFMNSVGLSLVISQFEMLLKLKII